ncbi:MAG: hypothetical protein ABIS38_01960 [Sphingomicrobium sp.]
MLALLAALAIATESTSTELQLIEPTPAERNAIFAAAGFKQHGGEWHACGDPGTASYQAGKIEHFGDINGDGRAEAIVTEGSTFCFGNTGTGFALLSHSSTGKWVKLHDSEGVATILNTRANGWPEIEVGGPGFCFAVLRWTGKEYAIHHHAYEGKACKP